ncbi:molybdopterin-dependent oxidoreductase [Chloroflexota bacterium]
MGSQDETTFYTGCFANCGGGVHCVFKAHLKDGVITRVEPDDRYNTGIGREDAVASEEDILRNRLQSRPCPQGLAFHRYYNPPDRVLYPLKRAPNTKRGEGKYVRISWEEALTTIADEMRAAREKYGPYSIMTVWRPGPQLLRLFQLWGGGVEAWGKASFPATQLMAHLMAGDAALIAGRKAVRVPHIGGSSPADMLTNSNLVVLWGLNPSVTKVTGPSFQLSWFIKLCRERGKRVIIIDPRYTVSAETLADQWIPIRPGTDHAMFLAMAHVLLSDNLWDKEFVAKYVEPVGFEKWRDYILGKDDDIAKTPEWAEGKCAVPAETIRELTHLVATTRPSWLWYAWGMNRRSHGEQTAKAFAALQAMLGYWGTPGGGPPFFIGPWRHVPFRVPWGDGGDYQVPKVHRYDYWAQAVLKLDKVRSGELGEDDYIRMVGWKADRSVVKDFNPRVLLWGTLGAYDRNFLVTVTESANYQLQALERMDFIATMQGNITPSARYADIILPVRDWLWEDKDIAKSWLGGWDSVNYIPGPVKPPGETKSYIWIHVKLAQKLGIDPQRYFRYYTTDENWDRDWERYLKDCYQTVIDHYKQRDITVPSWEDFTQGKFINCEELEEVPHTGYEEQMKEGKPFPTSSGKIEIYTDYIADETNRGRGEHIDSFGRPYYYLPSDWGDMPPLPVYRPGIRGMDDPLVKEYPLMLLTPHPRHRIHSWPWDTPWLREHVYRHRVWINPADARARDIKDDDMVRVYNDRGEAVMPAYVTSRVLPGVAVIPHGGKYDPDSSGVDRGAASATLLGGDSRSLATTAKASTLVQVEKEGKQP